jgi:hypothetical protein
VSIGAAIAATTSSLRSPERTDISFLLKMQIQLIIASFFRVARTVWAYVYKHETGEFVAEEGLVDKRKGLARAVLAGPAVEVS